ncbi:hypothetical protein U472_10690 [Orenia metallireducens]|jgi:hypothetical protein|uniref:Uncharacterized protein n=1 Tax=Orenia metallireducens TaxID=1413210 RepID=A0A1C0A8A5_9FIRM|nr:hypothetical protein [Orenia metallireducens]OCL26458.1 hypothetical protein U472_10690 [Orenia metallireducens]
MSDEKLKRLSELTGLDPEVIKELGADNLSEDNMELVKNISDMYRNNQEEFSNFLNDSGIGDILNNISQDNDINKDNLSDIKRNLQELLNNQDIDLDI